MILLIDNYDSFTHNLARYFQELGQPVLIQRNDQTSIANIRRLNPTHIVLSPGPKTPLHSGICLEILESFQKTIPILGVCLGHQCIGHVLGGRVLRAPTPVHGKVSPIVHNDQGLFTGLQNPLPVMRYHSLVIDHHTMPDCLQVTAQTQDGLVMAIAHRTFPLVGVQFHPESVLTQGGHALLENFLKNRYR